MKKITLEVKGLTNEQNAKEVSSVMNDISGVVAADVILNEGKAYAYSGDQLQEYTVSAAVREAGYDAHVLNEEYITDVNDYKNSLFPTAAPITSIKG